ncbi:MAG: hypothetical protein HC788_09085 [Sphingopyxis sp.]|nr:hypothetical protein [Sphingopyxis sp.]
MSGGLLHRIQGDKGFAMPPMREIQDSGIMWGFGTDAFEVNQFRPFQTLYFAVTGKMVGGTVVNTHTVSREHAQIVRVNGQYFIVDGDTRGIALVAILARKMRPCFLDGFRAGACIVQSLKLPDGFEANLFAAADRAAFDNDVAAAANFDRFNRRVAETNNNRRGEAFVTNDKWAMIADRQGDNRPRLCIGNQRVDVGGAGSNLPGEGAARERCAGAECDTGDSPLANVFSICFLLLDYVLRPKFPSKSHCR